jgi:hypothetical protein
LADTIPGDTSAAAGVLADIYRLSNLEPEATPREIGRARASHADQLAEWLVNVRASCKVREACSPGSSPRFVIAPPASGKTFEVEFRRASGFKVDDADWIVTRHIGWDRWKSSDVTVRQEARRVLASRICERVRNGYTVVGAHCDAVLINRLEELMVPMVWTDMEAAGREWRWSLRNEDPDKFKSRAAGKKYALALSRRGRCAIAPNLACAMDWPLMVSGQYMDSATVTETARGMLLLGARATSSMQAGRILSTRELGFSEMLECVDKTALHSMSSIKSVARAVNLDPMLLLSRQLHERGFDAYASMWYHNRKRLRDVPDSAPMVNSDIKGYLSPSLVSVTMAVYKNALVCSVVNGMSMEIAKEAAVLRSMRVVQESFTRCSAAPMVQV